MTDATRDEGEVGATPVGEPVLEEYVRLPTPDVTLLNETGDPVPLTHLARDRAALLAFVCENCPECRSVLDLM